MNPVPMPKPSLRDLQKWMRWIITDPRGVENALLDTYPKGLSFPSRYTRPNDDHFPLVLEHGTLSRSDRLSIYAEGYFARLVESMEQDFPTVRRWLGEERFLKLIADYLKAYPSRFPNIGEVGSRLPSFLLGYEETNDLPYLPDLSALEWAVIESFYADDHPKLEANVLTSIPDEAWQRVRFTLDSSVRLLNGRWPVDRLWRERFRDECHEIPVPFPQSDSRLLIFRDEYGHVSVEALDEAPFQVLEWMQAGWSLNEICAYLSESETDFSLMNWFATWKNDGVIRKIEFQEAI